MSNYEVVAQVGEVVRLQPIGSVTDQGALALSRQLVALASTGTGPVLIALDRLQYKVSWTSAVMSMFIFLPLKGRRVIWCGFDQPHKQEQRVLHMAHGMGLNWDSAPDLQTAEALLAI